MDKFIESLGVAALGMMTVFAGLIILIAFITILSKVTATAEGKKKNESKSGEVKATNGGEVPDDVMAAISAALAAYDETPSPDVVAAIAAALNIVMGEGKFVVKHIKRINNAPAWNRAGREEQMYSRF